MEYIEALSIAGMAFTGVINLALHAGPRQAYEQINYPDWGPPELTNRQEDS